MFDEETMERMEEEKLRIKGIERRLNGTDNSITGLLERMNHLEQMHVQQCKVAKLSRECLEGLVVNIDLTKDRMKWLDDKIELTLNTQHRIDKKLIEFETIKSRKEEEKSGK